jgi:hypothetical protein
MKWNLFFLVTASVLLLLLVALEHAEQTTLAEAIAEKLAPQVDVGEDVLRQRLEDILRHGTWRRILINCGPMAVLTVLLAVRLVAPCGVGQRVGKGNK